MTITGSNTTNFGFQKLGSNDDAGYSTINEVVDGIDTILNASDRLIKASQTPTVAYVITGDGADWVRGLVVTDSITDLNVTTGKLADLAVTTDKIADSAVTSAKIANDTIVNADINSAAAIVDTKLATISTAAKVSRSAIDTSGSTAGEVLTSTGSSATPTWQAASIGTTNIATAAVTYEKLAADAKTYDVPTSGTGVYFTASGDFTSASLSTASAQNPLVISAASSAIDLSLPNTVGTEGATITVCQTGTGTVTIKPKVGATATINGSTSVTYTVGAQYSVVTLICLSNSGSNGTWIITGDYA
jgi:hypothetical protein